MILYRAVRGKPIKHLDLRVNKGFGVLKNVPEFTKKTFENFVRVKISSYFTG